MLPVSELLFLYATLSVIRIVLALLGMMEHITAVFMVIPCGCKPPWKPSLIAVPSATNEACCRLAANSLAAGRVSLALLQAHHECQPEWHPPAQPGG